MDEWVRPTLIIGGVALLATLNALEFRGKRRRDREEMAQLSADDRAEAWFARKRHETSQNIEQVLHIMNTVLVAILIAILTA